MSKVDWLDSISVPGDVAPDEVLYPLDALKGKFEVREICENGYLVLKWEDEEKLWLRFAVLQCVQTDADGSNPMLALVFHGDGPSSNLREFRHSYWGEDGYLFYANPKVICAGLTALAEYYDFYDWPSPRVQEP